MKPAIKVLTISALAACCWLTIISCGSSGGGGEGGGNSLFTEPAYFVSVDDPAASDSNPGTMGSPFAGIQAAIDTAASAHSTANVYVAKGDYLVSYQSGTHVVLNEGISVYGSYSSDWSIRDRDIHPAVITDTSLAGGVSGNPLRAVEAGSTITTATVINGFDIYGGAGTVSAGIFVHSGSPTINLNNVHGGEAASFSVGIYVTNGSPVINGNLISAGVNSAYCMGVEILYDSSPIISDNVIDGGTGDITKGINQRSSAAVTISNNTISGGVAANSANAIYNETDSISVIDGNTLSGGTGGTTYGIWNFRTLSSVLTSNTISGGAGVGGSRGIYNDGVEGSMTIRSNTIYGGDASDSTGIHNHQTAPLTISENIIDGGSGYDSIGIYSYATSLITIEANAINGGSDTFCYGVYETGGAANDSRNNLIYTGSGTVGYGVAAWDASPVVRNNTIVAGSAPTAYGVYFTALSTSAEPEIENNILLGQGSGYGIYEGSAKAGPATVNNNDIFGFSWPFADQDSGCGGGQDCTIPQMEALADMTASGNVSVDPVLEDIDGGDDDPASMEDNIWVLTSSSPSSVTEGALDFSAEFTDDLSGTMRTVPWSMGAYEY